MKYIIKHLNTVNRHRWEVFKLCCKVGIPFRGMLHDLSKYSYEEFSESVKYYKKSKGNFSPLLACKRENGYSKAWLHHFGRNKHHFEYWYDFNAPNKTPVMPFKYALEMLCDRIAASKIYQGDKFTTNYPLEYFTTRRENMNINSSVADWLFEVLTKYAKDGDKILNKEKLYKLYLKHTKGEHFY